MKYGIKSCAPLCALLIATSFGFGDQDSNHTRSITGDANHMAFRLVEERQHARLRTLLHHELSPNLRLEDGTSLLMYAALHGDSECVRELLEAGADPNLANRHGATALIWGAEDIRKVKLLVEHGANIHHRSSEDATALSAAAGFTDGAESVAYLLAAGADPSIQVRGKRYPMARAAYSGNFDTVKCFVESTKTNENGIPGLSEAFEDAVGQGHTHIADYLMQWNDSGGLSKMEFSQALLPAMLRSDVRYAEKVLEVGAPLEVDKLNNALLATAYSEFDLAPMAEKLIQLGADPNQKAWRGYGLLEVARMRGHQQLEQILVNAGAKPGAPIKQKTIPDNGIHLTPQNQTTLISNSVSKSIGLLLRSSDAFLQSREACNSCHHQDLPLVAAAIAGARGIPSQLDSLKRIQENGVARWTPLVDRMYDHSRSNVDSPKALGYFLWGRSAQGQPAGPITKAAVWYLAGTQMTDGHWGGRIARQPLGLGAEMATALGIRALSFYQLAGRQHEFNERIERAAKWLEKASPQIHTDQAFRLLGLAWADADASTLRDGIESVLRTQKSDGGWSQLPNLESDAWATGLALMALHAAGMETSHTAYVHGMEHLLNTQFEDGSWFVRSRSMPSLQHFDSHFPFGWDQWISAAGTALASASLALSLDVVETRAITFTPVSEILSARNMENASDDVAEAERFEFAGKRTVDFTSQILPILEASCLDCHSGDEPDGNYKMTDRASLMKGGESKVAALTPGSGEDSQLIRHVTDQVEDMEMPPLRKRKTYPALSSDQVATLKTWISEGALWPQDILLEK